LLGGRGADVMDGGEGRDIASFLQAARGITADLAAGFAEGEGSDRLIAIEDVVGSVFPDYLRGDAGPNTLNGASGDDVLEGRDGDDNLLGSDGVDTGDGGNGSDNCSEIESELNCE
jgi:Ca2+-binding RTX toxin-like protein